MPGPRHDPPQHVGAFALPTDRDPEGPRVVARGDDSADGYDVLDEHGESIGFFAVRAGAVTLSAPHGLGASGRVDAGVLSLDEDGRPVLRAEVAGPVVSVEVPDRRLDVRLATAVVATVLGVRNS